MNFLTKLKSTVISAVIVGMCSCEHIPTLPTINYDTETQSLYIVQRDTAAHDTVYIYIKDLYNKKQPIKDTLRSCLP